MENLMIQVVLMKINKKASVPRINVENTVAGG
jgi:hypothetical protein